MPDVFPCPEPAELEQLTAGRRPPEELERLARHLEECHRCAATVDSLLADDTLVRNLAVRSAGLPAEEATVVANLIRRLSDLALLPAVAETLAEPTTSEVPRPAVAQEHYDFLSPAEGPGELGRLGGYRVLRVLGAGGMGVVFEAEDPQLRRLVALKVMKPALAASDSARQRFLREAQATAALEHDHIVAIYQVGQDRGAPFLAMPLLKGESLEDRLRGIADRGFRIADDTGSSHHPSLVPISETLRIGREMAAGLAAAHGRGLVHRDVKPANVWLEGTRGRVKLLDFGLARAQAGADGEEGTQLTQEGGILGTPAFMSPEQAKGQPVDARSDLFSLGCVLYRLSTGLPAFKGPDSVSTLVAITTANPKPPRELNRELPVRLSDLIMALLAKDREERPASAQAVVEAIEAIEAANREPGPGNRGRRRRTWVIAAAVAAALLLAGIVVIVRDRSGKEIARIQVPPGGNVETKESDDEASIQASRPRGTRAAGRRVPRRQPPGSVAPPSGPAPGGRHLPVDPAADAAEVPPPIKVPEPPPLEEWLKGRTVLTVAQDGSGQFTTIQAALDALQSGQVVKVLDRGPYREQLNVTVLPADTGLVSEVGTSIELPGYRFINKGSQWELEVGHYVREMDGFRLAGFKLEFPGQDDDRRCGLTTFRCEGFVLERCWLQGAVKSLVGGHAGDGGKPVCVRECLIEFPLNLASVDNDQAAGLVTRNLFIGPNAMATIGWGATYRYFGIKGNVFAGPREGMGIHAPKHFGRLEIANNTFLGSKPIAGYDFEVGLITTGEAIVCNNLRLRPGLLALMKGLTPWTPEISAQRRDAVRRSWRVAHNCYPRELGPGDWAFEGSVARFPGDILRTPRLMSLVAEDRDYLRPVAADPLARAGAGGDWPDYIGALPPGPAPAQGDWFTRLRERWIGTELKTAIAQLTDVSPPLQVPEPPPLEEWLKGRTVLTVAQDGSGQFKTIQAALEALQSGEVVSVLDRGPYRERLVLDRVPPDTGLISQQGAIIELSEWKFSWKDKTGDWYKGHVLSDIDGFRLHGFEFAFPEVVELGYRLHLFQTGGLVIEQCRIRNLGNETWNNHPLVLEDGDVDGQPHSVWVRGCAIEGYLDIRANGKNEVTAVVERNDFDSVHGNHHIHFHGDAWKQVMVRHNVFRGKAELDVLVNKGWKPSATLEVTNNTSTTKTDLVVFQASAEHGHVTVRNNLRTPPRLIGVLKGAENDLVAARRNWQVDHNVYPAASPAQAWMTENAAPRSPADVPATPRFLSKNPADADFLRIAGDGPLATAGAGGDWPSYVGALAPGPAPKDGDWFMRLQDRWNESLGERPAD